MWLERRTVSSSLRSELKLVVKRAYHEFKLHTYNEGGDRVARAAYNVGGTELFNELLPTMTGHGVGRRKL